MVGALAYKFDDEYSDAQNFQGINIGAKSSDLRSHEFTSAEGGDADDNEEIESKSLVLPVKEVIRDSVKLIFHKPIPVELEGQAGQYVASHEGSRMCGWGADATAALHDFGRTFVSVYLSYVHPEEQLSSGAKEFAEYLNSLVANVEKI